MDYYIRFLKSTFGNVQGDIVQLDTVDGQDNVYYYDSFDRYCYLTPEEEGTVWEWATEEDYRAQEEE